MLVFLELKMIECVPLAFFSGMISATMRFIMNYNYKHPKNEARLGIDYELIQLIMPAILLGTLFGV
jgi:hypothetical protein